MDSAATKINNDIILSDQMINTIAEREQKIATDENPWVDAPDVFATIERKINATV